jgi:allophanate hydrolase subunit 1
MFQVERGPMELLDVGDEVRFRPITREQFSVLENR